MHIYRRQASNLAWYDEGEPSNVNPFKKFRRRHSLPSEFSQGESLRGRLRVTGSETGSHRASRAGFLERFRRSTTGLETQQSDLWNETEQASRTRLVLRSQLIYLFRHWINVLLFAVPVGFALNFTHVSPIAIFFVNFVAIIPSSAILENSMNQLELYVDGKAILVGLIESTFGNAVQLIQAILLLRSRQINVLRVSLLGVILSNLLLLTGLSFLAGGLKFFEQYFDKTFAQTITMLLFLAVLSLVIPTASHYLSQVNATDILAQSRGIAIVIIISYGLWLLFQFKTHRSLFEQPQRPAKETKYRFQKVKEGAPIRGIAQIGAMTGAIISPNVAIFESEEQKVEDPKLSVTVAIIAIIATTALIASNTQFATNSIQGLIEKSVSPTFLGFAILPLPSLNFGVIKYAIHNKMDLAVSLSLNGCLQVALLVVPFTVLLAWWIGIENMSLEFDAFTTVSLFIAMIVLGYVIQEGKSNVLC